MAQQAVSSDYVDLVQLPGLLQQVRGAHPSPIARESATSAVRAHSRARSRACFPRRDGVCARAHAHAPMHTRAHARVCARMHTHSCTRVRARMQLNHSAKEMQMHQKNMGTQYAALKHEFDQSVRAAGAKTRELEKANMECKKNIGDQAKHMAKLTTQMQVGVGPMYPGRMTGIPVQRARCSVVLPCVLMPAEHAWPCVEKRRRPTAWWTQ